MSSSKKKKRLKGKRKFRNAFFETSFIVKKNPNSLCTDDMESNPAVLSLQKSAMYSVNNHLIKKT